jgi:2-keto-4-pentenoate hydratase
MNDAETNAAAATLMDEHARRAQHRSMTAQFSIADIEDAYAVQRAFVRLQVQSRDTRPSGYKIGLTSARMQAMCGFDRPVSGVILQDRLRRSGDRLNHAAYGRIGLEFEIAVRMARDCGAIGRPYTFADVVERVDAVCPAIEIVDDRHCDYTAFDVLSVVADNSWSAGAVLGDFRRPWPELADVEGIVSLNGEIVDRGFGRDVLGHPFHSVAWLAGRLAEAGDILRAGDIVMTGSLVTTKFPSAASHYRFDVVGLGAVEVSTDD